MCRSRVACMRNAREIRVVSFSRSYAVYNSHKGSKRKRWRRGRIRRGRKEGRERRIYHLSFSLVLVLKIILIVFSANDALVSKITNKRKEINSFRSFNLRDVLEAPGVDARRRVYQTRPPGKCAIIKSFLSSSPLSSNGLRTFLQTRTSHFLICLWRARSSSLVTTSTGSVSTPCFRFDPRAIPPWRKRTYALMLLLFDYPVVEEWKNISIRTLVLILNLLLVLIRIFPRKIFSFAKITKGFSNGEKRKSARFRFWTILRISVIVRVIGVVLFC